MAVSSKCYRGGDSALPVHMRDQLRTGPDARLQVTFVDNTVLEKTLGWSWTAMFTIPNKTPAKSR